ncbi:hypothetical protein HMY34_05250 [Thiothrix subterranea]|uniref:SWIM zinc finger family protein n=1 Tax=Thiothrix subterranea TaxID=2735563 RepID=UPI00192BC89F|nr:SWIM zinc finger family protein [Thiothrix subterranea]QQZ28208.1 hypothetical protein HMY34_05250 [Thiothrix subterranea]
MNLDNFEQHINAVIMQRGRGYTQRVHNLEETEPEFWQAEVNGTRAYDVEIQLDGKEISEWSCTCPYDGDICKHVAASLLNIRQQLRVKPTSPAQPTKRQQLDQVLNTLKREDLAAYIRQLLHDDRKMLDKFLLRFQVVTPTTEAPSKQYQQLFDKIARQYSSYDYIDEDDASAFADEVQELLDTLSASNLASAAKVEICFTIAQGIAGIANNVDDSNGELNSLMYSIKDELATAYPQLPTSEQATLFKRVLATQFDSRYSEYGLEDTFTELLEEWAQHSQTDQNTYLQALDKHIQSRPNDWQRDALLRQKLELLKTWNRLDDMEAVATTHMEIPDFRDTFIQKAIDAKDYDKARSLLQDGIHLAEQQKNAGTISRWRKRSLEIAYLQNDIPAIRTELEHLYQTSHYSLEHYRELKATYPAEEWVNARQRLYGLIPVPRGYDSARAMLLQEENDIPALYELIKQPTIPGQSASLFKRYAPLLAIAFPHEVKATYASQICDYLRDNTGRAVYERVIDELNVLAKMPDGANMAHNLVKDFCNRYKSRKAMVEMLIAAFGKG